MCGIAGFWNYRSGRPADSAVLEAMVGTLTHRGPDDDGFHVDGDLGMGMRRLSVVDLEGGDQPKINEDGSVYVVFNGEIYNHRALRAELNERGHQFRSDSDTEAIVHAYEEWGVDCLKRFNGMFAVAVWDARRERLVLARDRLGIKPLYVFEGSDGVVFGSELKSVITSPSVPLDWDIEALDDFLTYEYVPAPRSIVDGVDKLRPGTCRVYDRSRPNGPREVRYWTLQAREPETAGPKELSRELRRTLARAVERRLMADVPLGAFLSGGVDSSIIVALMCGAVEEPVRTFSMGFDDPSYNELDYARAVADEMDTLHREETVRPEVVELAGRLADYLDEPFADVSSFPTHLISALAREEVTVVLSGDGGDELFAGYDQYRAQSWADRLGWLTKSPAWGPVDRLLDWMPPTSQKKGLVNKGKRFAEGLRRPDDLEHARWFVFWDLVERRSLYSERMREALSGRDPFGYYRRRLREGSENGFDGLQRQLYADITGYLPDDILVKVDRMSMSTSLEARVPFLDHEVVELAMSIPDRWKLHNGETKWILKKAFEDVLPDPVLNRGKEGFSIPMKNWLRGPLRDMLDDLLGERLPERGWFDQRRVDRLVEEHVAGRENHAHRLWCLMSLELSLSQLEERAAARPNVDRGDVSISSAR